MSVTTIELTPHDPIIARDGRPFGAGQGNRMRGLSWPFPSVVAGSFRTALVKANPNLDFTKNTPLEVLRVEVAGVFPSVDRELYLPAPGDCVWNKKEGVIHAARPYEIEGGGCDFPDAGLRPVMFSYKVDKDNFKPESVPDWWPMSKLVDWLLDPKGLRGFDETFLKSPIQETRDHVHILPCAGAAAEGQIFATSGLNLTHLARYGVCRSEPFAKRFAEIRLSARVTIAEKAFGHVEKLDVWHPLGGERRLVHWRRTDAVAMWTCPESVKDALQKTSGVRMVLAAPAIFKHGWRPDWLDAETLVGKPIGDGPTLRLVGVSNPRWKAVSGWSLAPPRGPKPIRRVVPAGAVYFFEKVEGDGSILGSNGWLKPVCDDPRDRNDGFGLAVWGVWNPNQAEE